MTPTVSVIIAARDYGHYLADALHSVQRQTFTEWELVLVDDGSRDHTPQVVRPFLADPRIRYVRSDVLGQTRSKSLAFRLSRAPLIACLDGDDIWLPTKLERQVRLLNAEPNIGVVCTRRFLIDSAGALLRSEHPVFHRGQVFNQVLQDNFVCYSSVMLRREALEHVGVFDNRLELAVDYDLWLRVANHYSFDFIDEPLVKYRTGHANLSRRIVDRITLVLSAMRRCLQRRGKEATTPAVVQREAWGSTCRTMGFVLRKQQPLQAAVWYLKGAVHDRMWRQSLKSALRCLWTSIKRRR
jgi:glycosyltransferase involved in cell wall biosynthesis